MKTKLATAAVLIAAFAGSAAGQSSALDLQTWMPKFYTDSSMKTMRSDEESKAIMASMTAEQKAAMKAACADPEASYVNFCERMRAIMGGDN